MILNSDLILTHPLWERAEVELKDHHKIFKRLIDIFVIACSIGIKDDKAIFNSDIEFQLEPNKSIGRNTYTSMQNNDLQSVLYMMLENAIISSSLLKFDNEERLKLAFNPDYESKSFSPANFLVAFANYGIEQIFNNINTDLPSTVVMDDLYKYLSNQIETGYEELLSSISIDDLLEQYRFEKTGN